MSLFRFSNKSDRPEIEKIFKQVRSCIEQSAVFNWSDEQIKQELIHSDFYLSLDQGEVVQAFIAHRVNSNFVEIMALGTEPGRKQKGVMFSLLNDFVQNFSNQKLQVTLEVHEHNFPAISLYLKCGFKQVHLRPSYYKDGGAALVMTFSS
jgi:ribosomal-protein-alanine N-acetyltransferase